MSPWNVGDVEGKIKGLSDKQKIAWTKIANGVLARCSEQGGDAKACEGKAIRIANAQVKKIKTMAVPDNEVLDFVDALILGDKEMELTTVDLKDVEIFAEGTWLGKNSAPEGDTYTAQDLENMVTAFEELKDRIKPPAKLGHDFAQKFAQQSGLPALGWVTGLKKVGTKLLADVSQIPGKVAELIKAGAYKRISPEIIWDFTDSVSNKVYPRVLKAVALLGAELPAVNTLDDIMALYGLDAEAFKVYQEGIVNDDQAKVYDDQAKVYDDQAKVYDEEGTKEFVAWDTAYINDLPDSAFAYVSPGGEKDDRHLPYKDKDGKVDIPHLRNALARLMQTNIPTLARAKAKSVLVRAAEANNVGDYKLSDEFVGAMMPGGMENQRQRLRAALHKKFGANAYLEDFNGKEAVIDTGDGTCVLCSYKMHKKGDVEWGEEQEVEARYVPKNLTADIEAMADQIKEMAEKTNVLINEVEAAKAQVSLISLTDEQKTILVQDTASFIAKHQTKEDLRFLPKSVEVVTYLLTECPENGLKEYSVPEGDNKVRIVSYRDVLKMFIESLPNLAMPLFREFSIAGSNQDADEEKAGGEDSNKTYLDEINRLMVEEKKTYKEAREIVLGSKEAEYEQMRLAQTRR